MTESFSQSSKSPTLLATNCDDPLEADHDSPEDDKSPKLSIIAGPTNAKVVKYLSEVRYDQNLSMRQLGDLLNTQHTFISKFEKKGRRMDVGEFVCYCRALEKNPVFVLKEIMAL
ncbi:MAG: hypothetical protein ACI8WB_002478 [Phenylobacterium sp.]|jgi:hypothetical protein